MTTQSWLDEFYTDPSECKTDLAAAKQGLKKYIGARKENLNKHDQGLGSARLFDNKAKEDVFDFSNNQCAFCGLYWRDKADECGRCPVIVEGQTCYSFEHPFSMFLHRNDPEPLITLLTTIRNNLLEDPAYYQKKENTT